MENRKITLLDSNIDGHLDGLKQIHETGQGKLVLNKLVHKLNTTSYKAEEKAARGAK